MKVKTKKQRRTRVRLRHRQRIRGSADRPRFAVSRSLAHISAQVINDELGQTIVSASSTEPAVRALLQNGAKGGNVAGPPECRKGLPVRAAGKESKARRCERVDAHERGLVIGPAGPSMTSAE